MVIRPSALLAMVLVLIHMLAAIVVCATAVFQPVRVVALAVILLSLSYYLARDALLRLPRSWREVAFATGDVSVTLHNGSRISGRVADGSVVTPHLIVLGIYPEGRRLPVFRAVLPDAVGRDKFRALSVRLRFT